MQVKDLMHTHQIDDIEIIKHRCSQFIEEADGNPIIKNLPQTYENFQKVKVRKRKQKNDFSNAFNGAFADEMQDLRERAVFVNGYVNIVESLDPFYVFPVNGYQFMYSREVENSSENYKQVFESIFKVWDESAATDVVNDLLRFTYISEDLSSGIQSGAEIILYNIPYYYCFDLQVMHLQNHHNNIGLSPHPLFQIIVHYCSGSAVDQR